MINNVQFPQHDADILDAAHKAVMTTDNVSLTSSSNMISSLHDFQDGKCIFSLPLALPGQPINVMAGYDSRGNQTQMVFSVSGQTLDAADADAQNVASISTFVVAETTAELRISAAASLSIAH